MPGPGQLPQPASAVHRLEPHICRYCFGRIVSAAAPGGERLYRCTNCGVRGVSTHARVVCTCGMKVGPRDAGVRCIVNPAPSPECPNEIIAKEVG